jgi:hypothetical protein
MAACFIALVLCPVTAKASMFDKTIKYSKSTTNINYVGIAAARDYTLDLGKLVSNMTSVTAKSSNESIISNVYYTGYNPNELSFTAKKAGKANIILSGYTTNGTKKVTYKCKFNVVKYTKPIKTLKLGGKKIKGAFDRHPDDAGYNTKKKTLKLEITPASGWTIKKIQTYSSSRVVTTDPIKRTVKNKGNIKIFANGNYDEYLNITMYNKKLKMTEELCLSFN